MEIRVRNVHEALPKGVEYLCKYGVERDSRNGPVLVAPEPVITIIERPKERVLFHARRDANPFFHFFEALWMLAGRDDVSFVGQFVRRMETFSDDGKTLHGAYGKRWRRWFWKHDYFPVSFFDQIPIIVDRLKRNPDDRRCVLSMWDPSRDLGFEGKDLPCNTQIYLTRNASGALDMTVLCRSNDLIWGLCGANAVHFSTLQEYLADQIGAHIGTYYTLSNNYHAYLDTLEPLLSAPWDKSPYGSVVPAPLNWTEDWEADLKSFFSNNLQLKEWRTPYFRDLVLPLFHAHLAYKGLKGEKRFSEPISYLTDLSNVDWALACTEWLERRHANQKVTS